MEDREVGRIYEVVRPEGIQRKAISLRRIGVYAARVFLLWGVFGAIVTSMWFYLNWATLPKDGWLWAMPMVVRYMFVGAMVNIVALPFWNMAEWGHDEDTNDDYWFFFSEAHKR